MMGGRLRNALSGGGPISADVQTFVRTVFGCNMVQGYALTETCSIGCIQPMDDPRNGIVGVPLSSVEIKLESCKEVRGSLPPKQHRRNTHTHTRTSRGSQRCERLWHGPAAKGEITRSTHDSEVK
jgi:long-subunit acyl-CoA synthetase (AMP-forming)